MKLPRFILNFDVSAEHLKIDDKEFYNQTKNVLRLAPGDGVVLVDPWMNEAHAEITGFGDGTVGLKVIKIEKNKKESNLDVTLYCSILKNENFEWVAQKVTEIGITELVPVVLKRTVKLGLKPERVRKIMKEAAEQSGRGVVPELRDIMDFEHALDDAARHDMNLFFDIRGHLFSDEVDGKQAKSVGIFIGPEGGFTEDEVIEAGKHNFSIVNLGKFTLRGETAAIVACHMAISRFMPTNE